MSGSASDTIRGRRVPRWMAVTLYAAAAYNLLWGAWVVLLPNQYFAWVGMEAPRHPSLWQCVGMIVGVYGIGYAIAATDPMRHWPIVLVGMLGKIFGPIGYVQGAFITQELDPAFGWTIPTNDLIWWVPFSLILLHAWRAAQAPEREAEVITDPERMKSLLAESRTNTGRSLLEMSEERPVLLMLVRHFGCTFCRHNLAELRKRRETLDAWGVVPVVAHMSEVERGEAFLNELGLQGVEHVSDPESRLYRAMGLGRASFGQVFGLKPIRQAWRAMREGHGVGKLEGDGFQMPGAVQIKNGEVQIAYRPRSAGDLPDVLGLACGCGAVRHDPAVTFYGDRVALTTEPKAFNPEHDAA